MKTALYEKHVALGAKMVDFCGWSMPLFYRGIIPEHHAVRNQAGIFDISHMGRISVIGNQAEDLLDYLSTNLIAGKKEKTATYTVLCKADGTCVDDVIVYKRSPHAFFVVANAANRQKDLAHIIGHARAFDVHVEDHYHDGILAVQGPKAESIVVRLFPGAANIKAMHFETVVFDGEEIVLSRTGYTGAGGFELYASNPAIVKLWDRFLEDGRDAGIRPAGLGARDTLRLEMGFALYGHELSEDIAASETVAAWTIKWDKHDFLGKQALKALEQSSNKRSEAALLLLDKGVAREGYPVFKGDRAIGRLTSGTFSPTLNQSIAIALVEGVLDPGEIVEIGIRDHRVRAQAVKLPFLKTRSE